MYIYLVCQGDVQGHETCSAWQLERDALQEATHLAEKFDYIRDDSTIEGREIALWFRSEDRYSGRMYGYICVEKRKLNG
jgi:hypothetical protein